MNQRLLSGLSATLLVSTIGVAPSSIASEIVLKDERLEDNVSSSGSLPMETRAEAGIAVEAIATEANLDEASADQSGRSLTAPDHLVSGAAQQSSSQMSSQSRRERADDEEEAVKVGEYQSQLESIAAPSIAEIYAHEIDGRPAATLYVSGIPVLTFLGDSAGASSEAIGPSESSTEESSAETDASKGIKVAVDAVKSSGSSDADSETTSDASGMAANSAPANARVDESDPVSRATAIAARINQLHRNGVDADEIVAEWDAELEAYTITVGDDVLLEFDSNTMLPDTTQNSAEDVLQATNRIRRLMGGAEPLSEVEGVPQRASAASQMSFGGVQFTFSGMASWYGPGFHGRRSASGEVFNQNALTAAHRSLPFGTLVRVTNLNTGASVTVRINDRGPYSHGRVIDLSAAAARSIGLIQSGVARVQVDVIDP